VSFLVGRVVAKHRDPQLGVRWRVTKLKHDLRALAARHVILAFSARLARLMSHHKSGGETNQVLAKLGVERRD
jgi:hypothetical protein